MSELVKVVIDGVSYWQDNNGNMWEAKRYTKKQAIEYSNTMIDSYYCINCHDMTYCTMCSDCEHCKKCSSCKFCYNCFLCVKCYICSELTDKFSEKRKNINIPTYC